MIQSIIIIGQHLKKNGNICIFKFNCLFQFTFSLKYGICEFLKIFFFIWPTCEHVCVKIFTRIHWIDYKTICWLLFFFQPKCNLQVCSSRPVRKIWMDHHENTDSYVSKSWNLWRFKVNCASLGFPLLQTCSYQCWSLHFICPS